MTKKINVSELAETLYPDLDNLFSEDYHTLTKEINKYVGLHVSSHLKLRLLF